MHKEALESRRSVGDRAGVATSLYNLGNVLEIIGDLPRAHHAAAESLEIRQQLGERRSAALTMSRLANIRRREGDLNEALGRSEEAVTSLKTIGDRGGVAMAQFNLGLVLFDRGDLAAAARSSRKRWPHGVQQHDRNNTAQVAAGLARVALAQDRLPEATSLIAESISLRQELGEIIALAESNLIHAAILLEQDKAAAAEKWARDAAATFHRTGAWGREGEAGVIIASAQLARGAAAAARETLAASDKYLSDSKDARLRLWRDRTQARVLACARAGMKTLPRFWSALWLTAGASASWG